MFLGIGSSGLLDFLVLVWVFEVRVWLVRLVGALMWVVFCPVETCVRSVDVVVGDVGVSK